MALIIILVHSALLSFKMVFDILEVNLFVDEVISRTEVLHILSAQHSEVVEILGHFNDRFADLSQAKSNL